MKKVFSKTGDVCRLWATQAQEEARTGSNTSFRGDSLYIYGTLIACIVPRPVQDRGRPVALVSTSRWGTTTAVVLGEADREAGNAGMAVFRVPHLSGADRHERNLVYLSDQVGETLDKLVRGRATSIQSYRSAAAAQLALAANYAATFGIEWTYSGADPATVFHASEVEA